MAGRDAVVPLPLPWLIQTAILQEIQARLQWEHMESSTPRFHVQKCDS